MSIASELIHKYQTVDTSKLSACEALVMELMATGHAYKEISSIRGISRKTCEVQGRAAMDKTGLDKLEFSGYFVWLYLTGDR